jgi:hypothetical protein
MYSKHFRLLCVCAILLLAMMACNISTPGATSTPVSTTEIGKDVPTATETEPATETATLEPSLTPTETPALEPSETATPEPPTASVVKESNCRAGPGGAYELVTVLKVGENVDVIGRDLGAGFVFVKPAKLPEGQEGCWMLITSLDVSGDVTPLPAFTPLPSPTLAPSFTVKYKNTDSCKSTFVRFIVVNTGSSNFRSAYIKVTNLKTGESTEQSVNAFDLTTGCIVAQNIAPLTVGSTGYLQSDIFKKTPKGQKMRAIFQLCTEQFLKGSCATQTLEFIAK